MELINNIKEEILFGVEVKKPQVWGVLSGLTLVFSTYFLFAFFTIIFIYMKRGETEDVVEFLKFFFISIGTILSFVIILFFTGALMAAF